MGVRIAAVTLDDVARVADRYLRASNSTVGTFEPQQTEAAE
jgi:predicted Zn-dependent peptidase